jgi:predicted lipoprotein with Yx(FWY)xxD motif
MKRILIGLAAVVMIASSAVAAEPWKILKTSAGAIWTNQSGMTLYVFDRDHRDRSSCYGQCEYVWPPFRAGANARAIGEWTIVTRKDGTRMWAYDGHPLYTYIRDKRPGQVTGNGVYQFGALWHVVRPGYKAGHYKAYRYGPYKAKSGGSYGSVSRY